MIFIIGRDFHSDSSDSGEDQFKFIFFRSRKLLIFAHGINPAVTSLPADIKYGAAVNGSVSLV